MPIQILSEEVVAQIAAGEVVERPASVVKELLENALDAGAGHIRVEVTGGGRQRIRISDDGSGMSPDDAPLAFHRHATSKLRTADDLTHITTLGFRGEALASIASVSHLTMVTRHAGFPAGTLIRLQGGQVAEHKSVGAPIGTVITVENLFYNTPARLKFLKKDSTERRHIALIVSRYAMAYPGVRFVLEQDGRELFRSSGSGQLGDVLVAALGLDTFRDMVEINAEQPGQPIRVYGYTSAPSLHRADRTHITLFVNGRWIQDTRLAYAVTQAYHTFLMTGRYPVSVLLLEMPSEEVDVNVHPTKAEVRFRSGDSIFAALQRAVRRAIIDLAQTPAMRGRYYSGRAPSAEWGLDDSHLQLDLNLDLESPGQYARYHAPALAQERSDPTAVPVGLGAPVRPRTLPILRAVGQIGATYIVAEGPAGMYLIDQHAAHERILYEQFMEEQARQEQPAQYALSAQSIHLPPVEARLVEENLDVLHSVGFSLEPFGPNTFVVRAVPALLADQPPADVLTALIEDLESGVRPGQASIEERIVQRVCKQAAVKAGQILSLDEMQGLIRQLERCQSPLTCPHGRPTMIHMTTEQLARQFGRLG
ncbi:MAG: DNA mismatch repair endonuclease MutL [Chloroflexi bacterium]|nr:DNA mismatch repair endonuclease MutL [Chloroflexota bacterium]